MFDHNKNKRLKAKCKRQENLIKEYISAEKQLEADRARAEELVSELEAAKERFDVEIAALKKERKKYMEVVKELATLKKEIFKEVEKRGE